MGKGSPKIEITEFYMSQHFGICIEADALLSIIVKEKTVWSGNVSTLTPIAIDEPDIFGGQRKEGGLRGTAYFLPGRPDQVLPDVLAQRLGRAGGTDCPGFRGLSSLFFIGTSPLGFYWTANTPYLPGVWAEVTREPVADINTPVFDGWYARCRIELVDTPATLQSWFVVPNGSTFISNASPAGGNPTWPGTSNEEFPDGIPYRHFDPDNRGVTLYWCDPSVMASVEAQLRLQFGAGSNPPGAKARFWWQWWNTEGAYLPGHDSTLNPLNVADSYGDPFAIGNIFPMNWYPQIGTVDTPPGGQVPMIGQDANPAAIIYECLTNVNWGMGTSPAGIDADSFGAAANVLADEEFGLSMLWTRQASIEDFVQEILDHIQAVLYIDPATGLFTLKLVRGDYVADDLPVITPDNADLTNFARKLWGEIVNEITVTWTNPINEQEETITVQDDASIAIQGAVIPDSRNYYGVRTAELAKSLAMRDLRSAGQPLASCEAEIDRTFWQARPAGVVKLTWPEYGLDQVVMRAQSVDYGRPGDPTIKLSLVEDVFGLDIGSYDSPPSSQWTDPSTPPAPVAIADILTLPYFFMLGAGIDIAAAQYPEVLAGVLATSDSEDTFAIELWDEVTLPNASTEWQSLATLNVIGYAELAADLIAEALSDGVLFDNLIGQTAPTPGGFVIIGDEGETGNEIAMVAADNGSIYGFDLVRGTLDTVPRSWPAGTPVWFVDGSTVFEDTTVRAAAEVVDYKLRTRTSLGLLALDDAPIESATLTERPWLPNRPANVRAYGQAWSSELQPIDARNRPDPWVTVEWANRNRLDEDSLVLAWTDASQTPETGQTTTIEVRAADGTLLTTHADLPGTSFDVPDASFGSEAIVRLRVYAERSDGDGDFVSLQFFEHWVQVANDLILLSGDANSGDDHLLLSGDETGRVIISEV